MGSIRPSNIKRIAEELVDNNKDLFNEDFNHNKEILHSFIEKTVTKKQHIILQIENTLN